MVLLNSLSGALDTGESRLAPLLSLVVLSFQRFEQSTGPCLASLAEVLSNARIQLVLIDNGSDDGSAAQCAAWTAAHPTATFLPQPKHLGFAGGMNVGVAATAGDWICLVTNDTLFPPGAIDALLVTLGRVEPEVAMVGPVSNVAGTGQRLPLRSMPIDDVLAVGRAAMRAPTGLLTPSYRTDFFCAAVRRAAWQRLDGLDAAFGLGLYEDFDFSLRLRRAGLAQVIAEDVFVARIGATPIGLEHAGRARRHHALLRRRHPDVRFEHTREGNAQALRHLLDRVQETGWNHALRQRASWRLAALLRDEAKSPLKRWRWRWATRDIRRALAAADIEPRFPVAPPHFKSTLS